MKKMITAFALAMVVLAGCSSKTENETPKDEPTTVTLDATTFSTEMGKTEDDNIRVYFANPEKVSSAFADGKIASYGEKYGLAELKTDVTSVISGLALTEDADQNKVYGDPLFFVDLNKVLDENYQRFVVYENMIVIVAGDSFKNYTLDDASKEAITSLYDATVETISEKLAEEE